MDLVAVNVGRRGTRSYIFLGISKLGVMKIQRAIEFCGILFVCSLCFCVPSGLTWAASCRYLAYISSRAFRVNLSHSMCEKVLQGVSRAGEWQPGLESCYTRRHACKS